MQQLNLSLQEIQVDCAIVEWEGEPCLFVQRSDESATMCRLKTSAPRSLNRSARNTLSRIRR